MDWNRHDRMAAVAVAGAIAAGGVCLAMGEDCAAAAGPAAHAVLVSSPEQAGKTSEVNVLKSIDVIQDSPSLFQVVIQGARPPCFSTAELAAASMKTLVIDFEETRLEDGVGLARSFAEGPVRGYSATMHGQEGRYVVRVAIAIAHVDDVDFEVQGGTLVIQPAFREKSLPAKMLALRERIEASAQEAERQRIAAEEARKAAEEAERQRIAAEEAERQRIAAEEARKAAEEAERQRIAAEEAERQRIAAEEKAREEERRLEEKRKLAIAASEARRREEQERHKEREAKREELRLARSRATVDKIGFRLMVDVARVTVRLDKAAAYEAAESSPNVISLTLKNAKLGNGPARLPLETSYFGTAVQNVVPREEGDNVVLELRLNRPAGYRVAIQGQTLMVDVDR